jgi:MscS family membrane protein
VYFNQFDAASLGILLYVFFEAPDWATELRERHRLFVDILRLAQKIGVEFAFPTQTLYLHRGEDPGFSPLSQETTSEVTGQEVAVGLFDEQYAGAKGVRPPVVIEKSSVARQRRREQKD